MEMMKAAKRAASSESTLRAKRRLKLIHLNEFTPNWWWCYLWFAWNLVTWEGCNTRKWEMLNEFTMRWGNLAMHVVGRQKIVKTICYFADFYTYVRRQVEMDKLVKNFDEFVTYDADLLLAYIILDTSELKCLKFIRFKISLRDLMLLLMCWFILAMWKI